MDITQQKERISELKYEKSQIQVQYNDVNRLYQNVDNLCNLQCVSDFNGMFPDLYLLDRDVVADDIDKLWNKFKKDLKILLKIRLLQLKELEMKYIQDIEDIEMNL